MSFYRLPEVPDWKSQLKIEVTKAPGIWFFTRRFGTVLLILLLISIILITIILVIIIMVVMVAFISCIIASCILT